MKNQDVKNTITSHNSGLSKGGSPLPFRLVSKNRFTSGDKVTDHIYTFVNSKTGLKYYANCIEYRVGVFAVKFHLKLHKSQPNKYNLVINKGNAIPVLKTIVAIMLEILKNKEDASFAFIGMPRQEEDIKLTTRYCVYREFCKRYFSPQSFDHIYDEDKSFYMLLNKKVDTKRMFSEIEKIATEEIKGSGGPSQVSLTRSTH